MLVKFRVNSTRNIRMQHPDANGLALVLIAHPPLSRSLQMENGISFAKTVYIATA